MTQLYEIKVKLTENQKKNLAQAYQNRETIVLRLTKDALSGNDTLFVPATVVKRLEKNTKMKKGIQIRLSQTNIRRQGRPFGPQIAKTLGLSALAGLASEGASKVIKKISGGYLFPLKSINQLLPYQHLLTMKQKRDLFNGIQTGSGTVPIKLIKKTDRRLFGDSGG